MRGDSDFVVATSARRRELAVPMEALRPFCTSLAPDHFERMAFVFGREDRGLDTQAMLKAHAHVYIPTSPAYPVLNLAQCVQIVCYELSQVWGFQESPRVERADHYALDNRGDAPVYATAREMESFYQHLEKVACASGFLHPERPMHLMEKMRRLFQRARLQHNETQILRGLLSACENRFGR